MSEHTTGRWWYLCIGGSHHGGWREMDQSWFHFNMVNLVRGTMQPWATAVVEPEPYYRRRVTMDFNDGSYMYVLVHGSWSLVSLVMSVWNALDAQAEQSLRDDCPQGWPMGDTHRRIG